MKKTLFLFFMAASLTLAGCTQQTCANYTLDESHKITDAAKKPQGTNTDMRSPSDNSPLTKIVIDPDEPNITDEPWRFAYYSENEKIFWIIDMWGFGADWYGPYQGYPCLK